MPSLRSVVLSLGIVGVSFTIGCSNSLESGNFGNRGQTAPSQNIRPRPPSGPSTSGPQIVQSSRVTLVEPSKPSVTPGTSRSTAIEVVITVDRDALLSQEFIYGADLQYSSFYDKQMDLYNQSLVLGHIPARFRIVGRELQLVSDNKRAYPSDVNHPELLLSRYKILGETEAVPSTETSPGKPATLTLSGANSSLILTQLFTGSLGQPSSAKPAREADHWIRSFDYIREGNYLLQQTSLVLEDGTVAEFMESVFPRANLDPSPDFEKFEMDPEDPVGASSGPVSRFRMLGGEKIFEGEKATSYAQHFDFSKKSGTIDFYVTRNIPDEAIEPVRLAVEGWNRYFIQMKGIERPVISFKGRLPEGIHLGDPRYNIISWDSRTVAGAAYESQATDPSTGKQSHSLIYLPAAWITIGTKYWSDGRGSDLSIESVAPLSLSQVSGALRSARITCLKDLRDGASLLASGRISEEEIKVFGLQMLKQTLFHEVGHALGLGHNFKGSLAFDRSKADSPFSTSIMDYNDFEIERRAFKDLNSWDGPLLEYDRQALSAIYNRGMDIKSSDPVLPACNDTEADNETDGVDPYCLRYDIEKDPTLSIDTAYKRITLPTLNGDVTLKEALERVSRSLIAVDSIQTVKTAENLDSFLNSATGSLIGSIRFYLVTGKASFSRAVTVNLKSLFQFADGILPSYANEREIRERAITGVKNAAEFLRLPRLTTQTVSKASQILLKSLAKSPYFQSLHADETEKVNKQVKAAFSQALSAFEADSKKGLIKLRTSVFAALKRHPQVPWFVGRLGSSEVDYETVLMDLLTEATSNPTRSVQERVAAATSLVSYRGRLSWGDRLIDLALSKVAEERNLAHDNSSRENAETVLAALKGQ